MGTAYYFNGSNAYVDTPWVQNSVTEYTIVAWIRTTSSYAHTVVQDRGSGAGMSVTLAVPPQCGTSSTQLCPNSQPGVPAIGIDSNSIWIGLNAISKVNDGNWHFIAGVFSSTSGQSITPSNLKIYVDGRQEVGNTTQIGSVTSPISGLGTTKIGYHQAWNSYFNGFIASILIYNRALSDTEIQQIYNTPNNPPTTGLVLWFNNPDFTNECCKAIWIDKSGNGNNGQLYNVQMAYY